MKSPVINNRHGGILSVCRVEYSQEVMLAILSIHKTSLVIHSFGSRIGWHETSGSDKVAQNRIVSALGLLMNSVKVFCTY